eukprot:jgi/Phyca11/576581/estExt2_Genewise1.C_PHYCAscaffold_920012
MRLYHALLVTAVALLASNVSAGSVDCAMTPGEIVESSSGSAPKDSFDGFDSSNDSPIQQGSTTSSDVGSSQEVSSASGSSHKDSFDGFDSSNDSPIQQGSTTSSDVGSSQEVSSASGSSPKDSFDGFDSSNDSPIQQGSDVATTSSAQARPRNKQACVCITFCSPPLLLSSLATRSSLGSSTDSPVTQDSTAASDVSASEASTSNDDDTQQSDTSASDSYTPSSVDASQNTDVASSTAGDADNSLTFTEVPKTTTTAPTVVSSSSASGSSSNSVPTTSNNSTTAATTKPSTTLGDNSKLCAKPRIEITKVDVGVTVDANEDEVALKPVAIAAIPSGGSRIAFQSGDSIIVQELDASDKLVSGSTVKNWAAYFGAAISTSEGGCINIHQGDRMKVVDASGKITANEDSFDWGCSHSGYERVTYDNRTDNFAAICKTDSNNRIMPPKDWGTTIYPVDLAASNLGDIVPSGAASKYWATVSNGNGDNAKVHLIHFALNAAASDDITLGGTDANERAPHLASIGNGGLLAMWEGSSSGGDLAEGGDRTIYAQVLDASTGKSISEKVTVDKSVVGNRYQALKSYPDGSVAYLSKGASDTSLQVVRFYGC